MLVHVYCKCNQRVGTQEKMLRIINMKDMHHCTVSFSYTCVPKRWYCEFFYCVAKMIFLVVLNWYCMVWWSFKLLHDEGGAWSGLDWEDLIISSSRHRTQVQAHYSRLMAMI